MAHPQLLVKLMVLSLGLSAMAEERMATPFDLMLKRESLRPLISPIKTLEFPPGKGGKSTGARTRVNGCSDSSVFTTHYGMPPAGKRKAPPCDRALAMHPGYAQFLEENLVACVDQAASNALGHGTLSAQLRSTGNQLFHHGCVANDEHSRRSWHADALALDVTGIKVGDTVLRYADAMENTPEGRRSNQFFIHLRRCWGQKVANYSSSCRQTGVRGNPPGTIGNENDTHEEHLHLSLPCKNLSSQPSFLAPIWDILVPEVQAESEEPILAAPITHSVEFPSGVLKVKIEDTGGEPVNTNYIISVKQTCRASKKSTTLESQLGACAYDSFEKSGENTAELNYRTAVLDKDGVLVCTEKQKTVYKLKCN